MSREPRHRGLRVILRATAIESIGRSTPRGKRVRVGFRFR